MKCQHFFVTYDKNRPRGCHLFGIKSRLLPSKAVFNSSGAHCPAFQLKDCFKKS